MNILQMPLLLLCTATLVAYVCRLHLLDVRRDSLAIIAMHVSLGMSVIWSGYRAYIGQAEFGDFAAAIGAASWIVVSYRTWKTGVPEHFSRPMDLDESDWGKVVGRGK